MHFFHSSSMASEKQGYLGNLEEKSIQELKELLTREENILRKKKFVSSLPDKGKKIIEFRQKLLNLISKKQDLYHETALPQTLISSGEEKIKQHLNPLIKPKSRFSEEEKVFKSMENDGVEMTKKDVARDIVSMESQPRGPEEEAVIMHDNKSPMQTTQDNANTLPSPLQTAQITTDGASEFAKLRDKSHQGDQKTTQVVTNLSCGVNKTPKTAQSQDTDVNMLENAMERMEFGPGVPSIESEELRDKILENSAKVSSQFKTNRYRTREDPMDTDSDDEPEVEFYPDDVD
uniref:Protein GRINL1A n=1 Tax=Magallana gigas TaxID=29159 RepID=K1Q782_MAGGI